MKRKIVVALVFLAVIAASASGFSAPKPAEIGIGLTAGYPVGYAFYYEANYGGLPEPWPIFMGGTLRWKSGAFVAGLGVSYWPAPGVNLIYGYLDAGFAFDLWIFRFGLGGGVDVVNASVPGYPSYSAVGLSAKTSLDLKLGPVTVGVSAAFPMDLVMAALQEEGFDFFRLFAGHASLNVVYWLGGKSRTP
jgi:hypothetical protein